MHAPAFPVRAFDAAVIGGGIAGAAALFHLARAGSRCVLLERESLAGTHSTGRNAAMIRQNVADPIERLLAVRSAAFYAAPESLHSELEFRPTGSLLLWTGEAAEHRDDPQLGAIPLQRRRLTPRAARALVPLLEGACFDQAELCPGDGVLDVAALLQGYLGAALRAGAELELGARVERVSRAGAKGFRIESSRGTIEAARVIDACGAWCGELALPLGSPLCGALVPRKRHLFVTGPLAGIERDWPFTWDESAGFYFRPESGGLLFSPCDEQIGSAGDEAVDAAAEELALEKIARSLPRLLEGRFRFRFRWAGQRTFASDRRALVGEDPALPGWIWCGGLGGHGVSTAHEIGRLAALATLDTARGEDRILLQRLAPRRILGVASGVPGI